MNYGTVIILSETDPNLIKVKERFGKTHKIEAVLGTTPLLKLLASNKSVCWGDGERYHFRLTKIEL